MHRVTVCDVRFPGEFVALCAGRARDWYHPSFHQFSVLQRAVRDLSAAAEETVRRELPPEDRPALTRLSPLTDGALSLRPPTLRRPRREAELLTQLQQLAVALDGACPLVLDGSCGSHVTPSALLAPGELDAAASTTGLLAVSTWRPRSQRVGSRLPATHRRTFPLRGPHRSRTASQGHGALRRRQWRRLRAVPDRALPGR
ncbi:uncharacterized protein LOC122367526 isoform X2 [Amphibalanus amphitrite]|uniref:uncharacterized protein LOC122367526 isoform X2 n=1 Tax=Amphibalanus amphitrite TaxID=1232801 RepID=UPI001C90DC5D|nr:uncharacterized protein LOC122367526 isoform X2 [Amphibalanus amphitrite]